MQNKTVGLGFMMNRWREIEGKENKNEIYTTNKNEKEKFESED